MPKAKQKRGIDFASIEKMVRENPTDFFPPAEAERRLKETMRRMGGLPAAFDLETGQNFGEPKLSEDELKRRGYPCVPFWSQ